LNPQETQEAVSTVNFSDYAGNAKLRTELQANLFVIENAHELNCEYRLFSIRGLDDPESEDYEKNVQYLVTHISRNQHMPAIICYKDCKAHLAIPTGYPDPPEAVSLIRTQARLKSLPGTYPLRFDKRDTETESLCVRFLQFALQSPLWESKQLWQPSAGMPFYSKQPSRTFDIVDMYDGFTFRIVPIEGGPLCICVDTTRKYLARDFLPADLSRSAFRRIKGNRCVYHFGHRWYEIKLDSYHDLNASEVMIEDETLIEYIFNRTYKPYPPYLLSLPKDCAVLTYRNGRGEQQRVPSALCRLTYDTESPEASRLHRTTIRPPHLRREEIHQIAQNYLHGLKFHSVPINLSQNPFTIRRAMFVAPDLKFGCNQTLSVRGTPGARHVTLQQLGMERLSLLYEKQAGFWSSGTLDRQYLILPKSMGCTIGRSFLEDLTKELGHLYPDSQPYEPEEILYNDDVPKTPSHLGKEILNAVDAQSRKSGYGLVVIPEIQRQAREEDKLGHLVMRQLRERDIHVAVIHTTVPTMSYELEEALEGESKWKRSSDPKVASRLSAYLRNVAISKVLLLNKCWPFVLATPLRAQVVIGIDVKGHTAGFTFILDNGEKVRFEYVTSKDRERLSTDLVETVITKVLREELGDRKEAVTGIVFHRQGRAFRTEVKGIKKVLESLRQDKLLSNNLEWGIVEIPKTSLVRLRLFEVTYHPGREKPWVVNPEIGYYGKFSNREGFVCTTGRSFPHPGCVRPLLCRMVEGTLGIEVVMEDIYALANLTWTRPEDCSRDPLSVRMNDIRLREVAGEYDIDDLRFKSDNADENEDQEDKDIDIQEVF
jgi:hypothetical protein